MATTTSTYFTGKANFNDVPVSGPSDGIDTIAFLDAAEEVVRLFDVLGNKAFIVVQNDLSANIQVS